MSTVDTILLVCGLGLVPQSTGAQFPSAAAAGGWVCVRACVYTKGCLPLPPLLRLYFANKELAKNSPRQLEADRSWWGWEEACVSGPSYLTLSLLTLRAAFQGLLRFLDPDGPTPLTPTLLCDSPCLLP